MLDTKKRKATWNHQTSVCTCYLLCWKRNET